jgi:hypothetical protein
MVCQKESPDDVMPGTEGWRVLTVPRRETTMANKNSSVLGVYRDRPAIEEAMDALRAAGFRCADISVLFQENQGTKDFAHEKNTKAPDGAVIGGMIGGITGAALGWLISMGVLAIPDLGALVAAGPILSALAGAGAVGAVGGIIGCLAGSGVPEYEAKRFAGRTKRGGILMSVHCDNDDWVKRARSLLRQTGAEDIGLARESGADFQVSDKPMLRTRRASFSDTLSRSDEALLPDEHETTQLP